MWTKSSSVAFDKIVAEPTPILCDLPVKWSYNVDLGTLKSVDAFLSDNSFDFNFWIANCRCWVEYFLFGLGSIFLRGISDELTVTLSFNVTYSEREYTSPSFVLLSKRRDFWSVKSKLFMVNWNYLISRTSRVLSLYSLNLHIITPSGRIGLKVGSKNLLRGCVRLYPIVISR